MVSPARLRFIRNTPAAWPSYLRLRRKTDILWVDRILRAIKYCTFGIRRRGYTLTAAKSLRSPCHRERAAHNMHDGTRVTHSHHHLLISQWLLESFRTVHTSARNPRHVSRFTPLGEERLCAHTAQHDIHFPCSRNTSFIGPP